MSYRDGNTYRWPDDGVDDFSSDQLQSLYSDGFEGAVDDPEAEEEWSSSLRFQDFGEVMEEFALNRTSSDSTGLYLPFLDTLKLWSEAKGYSGSLEELSRNTAANPWHLKQRTGDCCSFAKKNHVDMTRSRDVVDLKENQRFITNCDTTMVYSFRGHTGQGASPAKLANSVKTNGIMLAQDYEIEGYGTLPLSNYREAIKLGIKWGRTGPPKEIKEVMDDHTVIDVTRVRNRSQLEQAFRSGLTVSAGSGLGLRNRRDEFGFSVPSGSWNHDMCSGGFDERPETISKFGDSAVLIINSWGPGWIRGERKIYNSEYWIPQGSCWLKTSDYVRICVERGSCCTMSGMRGWKALPLKDYGVRI